MSKDVRHITQSTKTKLAEKIEVGVSSSPGSRSPVFPDLFKLADRYAFATALKQPLGKLIFDPKMVMTQLERTPWPDFIRI